MPKLEDEEKLTQNHGTMWAKFCISNGSRTGHQSRFTTLQLNIKNL